MKDYITKERKEKLESELKELMGPKRREILESLQYAKSLGDLSENAEYHQAREEQGKLEEQIKRIEKILRSSEVISVGKGGEIIEMGSKALVQKEGTKEEKEYEIVGSEEADMAHGRISNRSPFGEVLLGKKKGDSVSFKTPNGGTVNYKIIKVY